MCLDHPEGVVETGSRCRNAAAEATPVLGWKEAAARLGPAIHLVHIPDCRVLGWDCIQIPRVHLQVGSVQPEEFAHSSWAHHHLRLGHPKRVHRSSAGVVVAPEPVQTVGGKRRSHRLEKAEDTADGLADVREDHSHPCSRKMDGREMGWADHQLVLLTNDLLSGDRGFRLSKVVERRPDRMIGGALLRGRFARRKTIVDHQYLCDRVEDHR
jgi:hypothetical protein